MKSRLRLINDFLHPHTAFLTILAANLAVFVGTIQFPQLANVFMLPQDADFLQSCWGLIGYQFGHAGFAHLFGNFAFVFPFACWLEKRVGPLKFTAYWLLTGISSAIVFALMPHLFPWGGLVGSSGACFGIAAATLLLYDDHLPLRALATALFSMLLLQQLYAGVVSTFMPGGVAYFGHVGGALGALILVHWLTPPAKAACKRCRP